MKLYARYEARLGAVMTKTLGSAALQLYVGVASMFFPIENQPAFVAYLEADLFVGHALSSATCELYHRYGMFLAPLTAALTTMKHCQFRHQCPQTINDDGEPTDGGRSGKSDPAAPDPVPETTKNKRAKDPKKVAAGHAGTAARKAKMLEALRAAKEILRSLAVPPPQPRRRGQYSSKRSRVEGPGTCRQRAQCSCCFATTGT